MRICICIYIHMSIHLCVLQIDDGTAEIGIARWMAVRQREALICMWWVKFASIAVGSAMHNTIDKGKCVATSRESLKFDGIR